MARRQLSRMVIAFLILLGVTAPGIALMPQYAMAQDCSNPSDCPPPPTDCTPESCPPPPTEETPRERIQRLIDERMAALEARRAERQAERHARLCEALPYLSSCT